MKGSNHSFVSYQQDLDDNDLFSSRGVISADVAHLMTLINIVILGTMLSLFGIFSNILNIIMFTRQGFQETVNISLCGLAVSDLLSQLTLFWITITFNPLLVNADVGFLSLEVEIPTGAIPHLIAINATCWLTAFVTLERCICVVFPLKVKDILTPTRAKIIVVTIFVLVIVGQIPGMLTMRLSWKFEPGRNKTVLGLVFVENTDMLRAVTFFVVNVFGPVATFTTVSVCTITLVIHLNQSSKWRQSLKTGDDTTSVKDKKVVKMVLAVAIIFIISFIPSVVILIQIMNDSEFAIGGKHHNDYIVALDFVLLAEAMNGSVNIFVYYNMSSRYKATFHSIFCAGTKKGRC